MWPYCGNVSISIAAKLISAIKWLSTDSLDKVVQSETQGDDRDETRKGERGRERYSIRPHRRTGQRSPGRDEEDITRIDHTLSLVPPARPSSHILTWAGPSSLMSKSYY